jgi:hypothetical protein
MTKPEYYRCPLRRRRDIIEFLLSRRSWSHRGGREYWWRGESGKGGDGNWLFCFNVKAHQVDLTFENLVKRWREMGYGGRAADPHWVKEAREKFQELEPDDLLDLGVEGARRGFVSSRRDVPEGKPDDDGFSMLWNGTPVETRFAFMGRGGGWLVLTEFNGRLLDWESVNYFGPGSDPALCFEEWTYRDLRRLYQFLVMLAHDVSGTAPERAIEEHAAFDFFENICFGLPGSEALIGMGI